ncbi:hypothetical protein CGCA056_v009332 [Colletotrichum aenigma]|uniref:uncharacterized protein n=1 Tax=Colletotrichum aenigma TaxID=1215731 RepID=UPI0018727D94|nr:uncharacterized protein CGCA056_v009332 [Colletotrichum aenigma]KAF5519371.1 hypothetical protein CGCA056_v009332 [Colletotrichum aenigma]
MSYSSKTLLISALLAVAEARFGQEQTPVSAVSSLQNVGNPGEAATLAGGIPGVLLAAANPCDKLTLADKIVTQLGDSAEVLDAAKGLVAAEQNFNPFVVSVPNICGDASLPATEALRGIVPLVDPAVTGSDTENANSATSKTTPFDATGLSVADVMKAQGFSNFTTAGAAGGNAGAGNNNNNNANDGNANNNNNNQNNNNANTGNNNANTGNTNDNVDCGNTGNADNSANTGNASNNTANAGNNNNNNNNNNANTGNNNNNNANTGNNGNANTGGAATGAADFGKCTPTMDFQLGRAGRKADQGTFLPTDPLVAQGQQDALNPNIITNRICDQLINVCEANDAAHQQCLDAKAQILASGDKSEAVATTFNGLLGF